VAAAGASTASAAGEWLCASAFGGFAIAAGWRGENGELDRFPGAFALGASDNREFVHHETLVALAAIVAKVFVDWHSLFLVYQYLLCMAE
jgi:hypothetical protein